VCNSCRLTELHYRNTCGGLTHYQVFASKRHKLNPILFVDAAVGHS
jgi:hypothetical protein